LLLEITESCFDAIASGADLSESLPPIFIWADEPRQNAHKIRDKKIFKIRFCIVTVTFL